MQKFTFILLSFTAVAVHAQTTPIGLWQSIDDSTNKPKAEIRITEDNGVLTGRIVRSLETKDEQGSATCDLCPDDRKGKPMIGLDIVRGAKANSAGTAWEGGQILDPNNGKTYTLRLAPIEQGSKLQVRGYIGPFYRTQVWNRVQ
jgi:uncharacterized protein (DUF2147 family)